MEESNIHTNMIEAGVTGAYSRFRERGVARERRKRTWKNTSSPLLLHFQEVSLLTPAHGTSHSVKFSTFYFHHIVSNLFLTAQVTGLA